MEERHYAGVYWEDRKVTKDECVTPILDSLARVGAHDPLLSRWYVMRGTREETLGWELTEGTAREKLVAGIVVAVEDMPEFGWSVVLWNGEADQRSAKIELGMGGHMRSHASPTPNSCVVRMPWPAAAGSLLHRATMTALLGDLALVWSADWGVVSTDSYLLGGPPPRPSHHPRVGWLTFLHGWRGRAPRIPGTHVTPVGTLGYVIGTEDDRFTLDDPAAVGRVTAMEDALERAERLQPRGAAPGKEAPETRVSPGTPGSGGEGYRAALDVASAVDALASRIPGRRGDLAEALHRASTMLAVVLATGDDAARAAAEVRALLDVVERLFPELGPDELTRAREGLARVAP
jgi:hypothetical protein